MKKRKKIFDLAIQNLLQIGSIYQYLRENWDKRIIKIKIIEDNIIKRQNLYISSQWGVNAFYSYLLSHFAQHQIHITIWETET